MKRLRILLPDACPDETVACEWAVTDDRGVVLARGEDPLANLPPAARCEAIAPASRVLLKQVTLPKVARSRRRALAAFAVEDSLTAGPESAHIAVGRRARDGRCVIAVVELAWMQAWTSLFAAHGRALSSMHVETCLAPLEPGTWTVVWRGHQGFVRTGDGAGMALDCATAREPPLMLQLALREAQEAGAAPRALVLRQEGRETAEPLDWQAALDDLPCERAPAWDWRGVQQMTGPDLLQGRFAPTLRWRGFTHARSILVVAAAAALLHVGITIAHWAVLRHERTELHRQMRATFTAVFPEARAVADPPVQMRRQLERAQLANGAPHANDCLIALARIAPHLQAAAGIRVQSVACAAGALTVDVEPGGDAARALSAALTADGVAAVLEARGPLRARVVLTRQGAS